MNATLPQAEPAQEPLALTLLQAMRYSLCDVLPTPEGNAYRRGLGCDWQTLENEAGCLVVTGVRYHDDRTFDLFDEDETGGVLSAIVEVHGADVVTVEDLCAWPLHRQDKFATALDRADALGAWQVQNPATYSAGQALRIHRTPESWLRSHCRGVVILSPATAPYWLASAPGPIATEDVSHAREVARLLHPYFDTSKIIAPERRVAA